MATPYDLASFDGTSIGPGTDYDALFRDEDEWIRGSDVASESRRGTYPLVTGSSLQGRALTLRVWRAPGSALTRQAFREDIQQIFDPNRNPLGIRYLTLYGEDGTTLLRLGCYVLSLAWVSQGTDELIVQLWAPWPVLEASSATTSGNNPASVTNAGNVPVYPTVTLTSATTASRRRVEITSSISLAAYPVNIALGAIDTTRVWAYVNGNPVPIGIGDNGNELWILVDVADDGTPTVVDMLYGASMPVNPLAGLLDDGGMDWGEASNTTWKWDDWSVLSAPARNGTWRPALTGAHNEASGASYAITQDGAAVVIALGAAGAYDNSADSLVLAVDSRAGLTSALANLRRVTANLDGTNARAFVRYQVRGSSTWLTAWSSVANGTVSTAIDLDNAVRIAVGIENHGATADPATLTIDGAGSTSATMAALTIGNAPTVSAAAAETLSIYDGDYTIAGRTITFDQVFALGDLVIDCHNRTITASGGGPIYGAIAFSDPEQWLVLLPGSNAITDGLGVTDVVSYRDGWG